MLGSLFALIPFCDPLPAGSCAEDARQQRTCEAAEMVGKAVLDAVLESAPTRLVLPSRLDSPRVLDSRVMAELKLTSDQVAPHRWTSSCSPRGKRE